jgi:TolB-like protein/Tfp pilus assembly protein PilF
LNESSRAVFLSYASEDAAAALRICEALRAAGIEVWFDQRELRGGDAWDHMIHRQIHDCALFLAVISTHTNERDEGYFRREWNLAVERTVDMAGDKPFLLPVVVDATPEATARVPDKFRHIHWTRLPEGNTPPAFVARVARLLSLQPVLPDSVVNATVAAGGPIGGASRWSRTMPWLIGGAAVVAVGYVMIDRRQLSSNVAITKQHTAVQPTTQSAISENSIAVLPFVDMSEKHDQQYFADGLSEELIDHLARAPDLKVIARTSSFKFKDRSDDVRVIASTLGVDHLLEGSVRKSGRTLRITAQLIRASDGVHLWSQTYDRDLVDIFKVQDEIGEKVSQALHVALQNGHPAVHQQPDVRAYNLVLEGNYFNARYSLRDSERAAQLYRQAINIDPDYALAWARLASAYLNVEVLKGPPSEDQNGRVLDALDRAIRLDPNLVWAYYTRGGFAMNVTWNWAAARADTERMRAIDPRSDLLPSALGDIAFTFGEVDRAIELYQKSAERNPLDPVVLDSLGTAYCAANHLEQCLQTRLKELQLHPEFGGINSSVGIARLYLGQLAAALEAMQREPNEEYRLGGLAMVYSAMGRRTEADTALKSLTGKFASSGAYAIAEVHAYRGDIDEAFRWLDRAYRQHDAELLGLMADPLLRNLHGDPRFRALLSRMGLTGHQQSESADPQT